MARNGVWCLPHDRSARIEPVCRTDLDRTHWTNVRYQRTAVLRQHGSVTGGKQGWFGLDLDGNMIKPFSVRELMTRFEVRREGWRLRTRKATERAAFKDLFALVPIPIVMLRGQELLLELANEAALKVLGSQDVMRKSLLEALPELDGQGCAQILREVMASGVPHVREEAFIALDERRAPTSSTTYWTYTCARLGHTN